MDLAYYSEERADLVAKVPRPIGRVLDVGCGAGGVGRSLRAAGATVMVGVEPVADMAELARDVFDRVYTGTVEQVADELMGAAPFDTICCYDVLEHLVAPEPVIASLARLAAPDGRLHITVPNARKLNLVWDLVVRGTFGYTSAGGHRDATHLRWFTRRDILSAVEANGWQVISAQGIGLGPRGQLLSRLTSGRAWEYLTLQVEVLAGAAADLRA